MDKNSIIFKILRLDSLIGYLDWTERVRLHLYSRGIKTTTPKILTLAEWIETTGWNPPEMRIGQDRLAHFEYGGEWLPVEDYFKVFPQFKNNLNQFKK
jgi:hypothetical protein